MCFIRKVTRFLYSQTQRTSLLRIPIYYHKGEATRSSCGADAPRPRPPMWAAIGCTRLLVTSLFSGNLVQPLAARMGGVAAPEHVAPALPKFLAFSPLLEMGSTFWSIDIAAVLSNSAVKRCLQRQVSQVNVLLSSL